jgi:hypothetical protein
VVKAHPNIASRGTNETSAPNPSAVKTIWVAISIVESSSRLEMATSPVIPASVASRTDPPPEKWTPGYADLASACSGVM